MHKHTPSRRTHRRIWAYYLYANSDNVGVCRGPVKPCREVVGRRAVGCNHGACTGTARQQKGGCVCEWLRVGVGGWAGAKMTLHISFASPISPLQTSARPVHTRTRSPVSARCALSCGWPRGRPQAWSGFARERTRDLHHAHTGRFISPFPPKHEAGHTIHAATSVLAYPCSRSRQRRAGRGRHCCAPASPLSSRPCAAFLQKSRIVHVGGREGVSVYTQPDQCSVLMLRALSLTASFVWRERGVRLVHSRLRSTSRPRSDPTLFSPAGMQWYQESQHAINENSPMHPQPSPSIPFSHAISWSLLLVRLCSLPTAAWSPPAS